MIQTPLIIRADAGPIIGTGHVMRCLALAEAWQDTGGKVFFVSAHNSPSLEARLVNEGMVIIPVPGEAGSVRDAEETARIAREEGADWVVVDGYHFGAAFQKTLRNAGVSFLFIDDYGHAGHYYADIVLNQNIYAGMSFYKHHEPYTRFLLGPDYVLIRREFLNRSVRDRTIPEIARKLLITMGGSDPDNITLRVIEAVRAVDVRGIEVTVVVGGANPHFAQIHDAVNDSSRFRLVKNAGNMPELMAWADVAISAGGSTCWELLFMGLPFLLIPIAENQIPIAKKLQSLCLTEVINTLSSRDPERLAKIISDLLLSREKRSGFSERMVQYVDGNGPSRILHAMDRNRMWFRNAETSDCERVWHWINEPPVRAVSFNTGPVPLDSHKKWFSSALQDPDLIYYIALNDNGEPIGQARFKMESGEAVISVLVAPEHRGRSLGPRLIRDATEKMFSETGTEKVKALIKTGNEVSLKAFIRAGYCEQGIIEHSGQNAHLLMKKRGKE
jgi:UDP-2,4-diacetamido-2,4,6-trideoxy-beta-L-altropyranose hydrolase